MRLLCLVLIIFTSLSAFSQNQWYRGKITRISLWKNDNSFIITVDNDVLNDCKWKYLHFDESKLGEARTKAAYSMALTAFSTQTPFGFVTNKANKGAQGECFATGMTADIRR